MLRDIEEGKTKSEGFRKIVAECEVGSPRRGDRKGSWCQKIARQRPGGPEEKGHMQFLHLPHCCHQVTAQWFKTIQIYSLVVLVVRSLKSRGHRQGCVTSGDFRVSLPPAFPAPGGHLHPLVPPPPSSHHSSFLLS